MEFTFCSFTYNQETFIIEQLESIKYQILNYGKGIDVYYVLADDASKDRTVEFAKRWLDKNEELFAGIEVYSNRENVGIVNNFINALKHITTEHFKILAGDDLYYKNNLFSIFKNRNFYISPLLTVDQDYKCEVMKNRFLQYLYCLGDDRDRIKNFVKSQYRYSTGIDAPGVFFDRALIDDGLFNVLNNHHWIEDTPAFHYFMHKEQTQISTVTFPVVLYRVSTGITHNSNSLHKNAYEIERKELNKLVHTRRREIPHIIDIYSYIRFAEIVIKTFRKHFDRNAKKKKLEFNYNMQNAMNDVTSYIEFIKMESSKYMDI